MNIQHWMVLQKSCGFCLSVFRLSMAILVVAAIPSLFFWWVWTHDDAPVVKMEPGYADKTEVAYGEMITFRQPVEKLRQCDGEVQRVISGDCGRLVVWAGKTSVVKSYSGEMVFPIRIPFDLKPGACSFRVHVRYFCNPLDHWLGRHVYESPGIPFVVKAHQ